MPCSLYCRRTRYWPFSSRLTCSRPGGSKVRSSSSARSRSLSLAKLRSAPPLAAASAPCIGMLFFSVVEVAMSISSADLRVNSSLLSTCRRKEMPPRRSRPRFIGESPIDCSHCGVFGRRFTEMALSGYLLVSRSRAWICTSVCGKKRLRFWPSTFQRLGSMLAACSCVVTSCAAAVAASGEANCICTVGLLPNQLGSASSAPNRVMAMMRAYFQPAKALFMVGFRWLGG